MTEEDYRAAHIELWKWLHDNPSEDKEDWPGWAKYGFVVRNCFACDYACELEDFNECERCPIREKTGECDFSYSIWNRWRDAETDRTRKKYAAIIRDAWREIQ
jgi:hypothetical protein